ncbi:hypothetical protein [Methylibium sp.]|uniref:hypothetical protein n=1 Tax=Methylibium sp. TaxID=2067992 RepID=UPI00286B9C18|nr:hypothetical protein [Methylibium sp.]
MIDTHAHADRCSGGPELARRIGARYCSHEIKRGRVSFTADAQPQPKDVVRILDANLRGAAPGMANA